MSKVLETLPWWAWVVAAAALVCILVSVADKVRAAGGIQTDPQRMFDGRQRAEGRRRCGNRCEHKSPMWFRCSGKADQADHVHPWSKGGATNLGNLQYLCVAHNRAKSDHVPSPIYVWRLQRRRLKYFPAGEPVKIAWRFGAVPDRRN